MKNVGENNEKPDNIKLNTPRRLRQYVNIGTRVAPFSQFCLVE